VLAAADPIDRLLRATAALAEVILSKRCAEMLERLCARVDARATS